MKKFGLVALLSLLTLGVAACGGNDKESSKPASVPSTPSTSTPATSTPAPSTSTPAPSTPTPSVSTPEEETVELPVAWAEGATYQAKECSVSLVPGSIENPNAKPVKDYLNVEGIRFIDLRDVKEGYGLGHIQGFESISYFNVIRNAEGAEQKNLFTQTADGFVANYEESEFVLNDMFPKDATLFVMCQVGGRVQPFLTLLAQYGYDMSKVYNIGGWNQIKDLADFGGYEVSLGIAASSITYDFSALTPVDGAAATKEVRRAAELPVAWNEGATYQAKECSISLVPGSIENPNAKPVKDYLTTENIRFIDLRDVKEGYGLGHIQKFESISYFNVIRNAEGAEQKNLFTQTADGFVANYEESEFVLNDMFPKDATLFVMCQVGGRVQPFLTLLAQLGYNMDNVYNIGGWNQIKDLADFGGYEVSLGIAASAITYDFSALTPVAA